MPKGGNGKKKKNKFKKKKKSWEDLRTGILRKYKWQRGNQAEEEGDNTING